ncbi:hypothetical protein Tco_0166219, partial [Tanacetum coccineum]
MSSSHKPPSKVSKKPKISVRPVWRKKMSTCHPSSEFDTPTPMPKQSSPFNDSSKENSPIASSNQTSPPLIDPYMTRVFQAKSPPQSDNQSQPTQPPFPCNEHLKENHSMTPSNQASPQPYSPLLIDPYVDDILQGNHNN